MQNDSKPVKFGALATEIVEKLHARHSSKATGRSLTLKVLPINSLQKPATNPPRRNNNLRNAPSKIMKVRKVGSR